jgi:hypothetical protein
MTVFVYVNTGKQVGDADHIKVFAYVDAAEKWFEENDPEGVAFEYPVLEASRFAPIRRKPSSRTSERRPRREAAHVPVCPGEPREWRHAGIDAMSTTGPLNSKQLTRWKTLDEFCVGP